MVTKHVFQLPELNMILQISDVAAESGGPCLSIVNKCVHVYADIYSTGSLSTTLTQPSRFSVHVQLWGPSSAAP